MRILTLVFFFLFALPVWAQPGPPAGPPPPQPVIVAPVAIRNVTEKIEALGTTRADETVNITATVTETVEEILFDDGQEVKAGDILARLNTSEEQAELKAEEALLKERQAAFSRAKGLQESQALSRAVLEERQANLDQSLSRVKMLKSQIQDRIITAPFDGVLGLRRVSVGSLVSPGTLITTIDDLDRIKVDFDVPSIYLAELKPGLEVLGRVDAYPGREFKGLIQTVEAQVDPVSRAITARAVLANEQGLLMPGLLMSLTLNTNPRQSMMIPEEALLKRGNNNYVYVVKPDLSEETTVTQKTVQIGAREPGWVEIVSGLSASDQVVIHGVQGLNEGRQVTIRGVEKGDETLQQLLLPASGMGGAASVSKGG